jgi:hypothetical protein
MDVDQNKYGGPIIIISLVHGKPVGATGIAYGTIHANLSWIRCEKKWNQQTSICFQFSMYGIIFITLPFKILKINNASFNSYLE